MGQGRISPGLVGLAVALLLAAGASAYLLSVKKQVERTTTPVPVAAPDFFPPDTLLLVAVHRVDEDWASVDACWKRVEPTASWTLLHDWFEEARGTGDLPAEAIRLADEFDRAMAETEARFGSRPTTRDFFETYGRYAAFGFVPAAGGGAPRLLGVVKLPGEGAASLLQNRLGGVKDVRRHDPPDLHGYPVFVEERGKGLRILYGVGGGYLFLADDAAPLDAALGRLAARAAGGTAAAAPAPSLSDDPVFRRGAPGTWEDLRFALFVRKDQQFARLDPSLAAVDGFLRHAFVLAPADPAICLSASGAPGGAYTLHASFSAGSRAGRPWEALLPAGLCQASLSRAETSERRRAAFQGSLDRLRGKALWKEIDALSRDTPRLQRILGEALGEEQVPPADLLARLPKDVELLGALSNAFLEAVYFAPQTEIAFGQKVYRGEGTTVQTVVAGDADAPTLFFAASTLDNLAEISEGWVVREQAPGMILWRLDAEKVRAWIEGDAPPETRRMIEGLLAGYLPSVVAANGCLYLVLGEDMRREVVDIATGKPVPTLADDPVFREAVAAVDPGYGTLTFQRPAESMRAGLEGIRGTIGETMDSSHAEPDARELVQAGLATLDEALRWGEGMKAVVTVSYADAARPSVQVALLDLEKEKAAPAMTLEASALRAPGLLPGGTFFLAEGRVQIRPAFERMRDAFLGALPGGRERWERLRKDFPGDAAKMEESLDSLVVDVKGETGLAVAVPSTPARDPGALGMQDLLDRIPGIVLFAEYADPARAFESAASALESLDRALRDETPFETKRRAFDRGRGPRPVGTRVERIALGEGNPAVVFRVFWPEGPRRGLVTLSLGVVRRGGMLLFSSSGPVLEAVGAAAEGGPGTFAARMKDALPEDFLPAKVAGVWVLREDGFAECLGLYFDALVPIGARLSLMGAGPEPAEDRVQAHLDGWRKGLDLVADALKTSSWSAGGTVREGDRLRTVTRRGAGK
jgi:hypothetical protein